jgi:hypothetical protein
MMILVVAGRRTGDGFFDAEPGLKCTAFVSALTSTTIDIIE